MCNNFGADGTAKVWEPLAYRMVSKMLACRACVCVCVCVCVGPSKPQTYEKLVASVGESGLRSPAGQRRLGV